eukprot:766294-Hanusia_phi.AAC.10
MPPCRARCQDAASYLRYSGPRPRPPSSCGRMTPTRCCTVSATQNIKRRDRTALLTIVLPW